MYSRAFVLSEKFIGEVWGKIKAIRESLTSDNEFMNYVKRCDPFSIEHLSQIIETAYWVSHATEERSPTNVSLVIKKPEQLWDTYCFDLPIPLDQNHLVKIGAALDSGFSDICLWPGKNEDLYIWGFKMRSLNHLTPSLRILILGPGKVLIICYG